MAGLFASSLVLFLALGIPIFVVLLLPVFIFLGAQTPTDPMLIIQRAFSGVDKFPLMAIPFFILAGNLMAKGGLSERLIRFANTLVRPLPGGLAMTSVLSAMFFSAISGSSPATVIAIGKIMMPAMIKAGYPRSFTVGLLMSAGSLGIIIPPSIFLIVYGAVTSTSVGALFLAGFGAGAVYTIVFVAVCVAYALVRRIPRDAAWNGTDILVALRDSLWGLAAPVIILGGIYGGFFTPTEAAAVAVVYAGGVSMFVYSEMSLRDLVTCIVESAVTTAQVMIIIAAASAMAWYLTTSNYSEGVGFLFALGGSDPFLTFMIINVVVIVAGMILDPNSIVIILVPFIVAAAASAGIDPVHLGIVLAVNAAIGMYTPPFGLNLFVSTGLGATYREAIVGSLPFIAAGIIALLMITYIPDLAMWLPRHAYAGH